MEVGLQKTLTKSFMSFFIDRKQSAVKARRQPKIDKKGNDVLYQAILDTVKDIHCGLLTIVNMRKWFT